ncbi:MAG: TlpA disulfide reductase family protein [Gammaproteobacteria bacterium]|jgi:peroxiredoxin
MKNKLVILFALLVLLSSRLAAEPLEAGHEVGQQAPGFSLKALDGNQYTLAQLTDKGHVLLVFWATECVYCYAHVSDFKKIHQQYNNKGLTLAAINIGGEYDPEVKEYVNDNELNYLVLSNRLENLDVAEAYKVFGTPTMVLVSPGGKILYYGHQIPELDKWIKLVKNN